MDEEMLITKDIEFKMDTTPLEIIKETELGGLYRCGEKVFHISHEEMLKDIEMKNLRTAFEERWPTMWVMLKASMPDSQFEFINTPRLREGALIEDIADVYYLTKVDLLRCTKLQDVGADKVISAINGSKERPLSKLLYGLGILDVGSEWARKLAERYKSIDTLARTDWSDLIKMPGLGATIASSVLTWFHTEGNWKIIQKLRLIGVSLEDIPPSVSQRAVSGKVFMFTGALSISRHKAQGLVEDQGGIAGSSVTSSTDYLVVGERPGSKLGKAVALGIPRITEEEFMEMLDG